MASVLARSDVRAWFVGQGPARGTGACRVSLDEGLVPERRRQIASLGGQPRQLSLLAARRLVENLLHAAAVAELKGGRGRSCA